MNWQEVCREPTLQNLPFKIELNRYGQVVMSPAEMEEKRNLYVTQGALEVWIRDEEGQVRFFNAAGMLNSSSLVPDFPDHV